MKHRHNDEPPRIVVGVDGFESSKAALRWAIHQAKLTGAVVDAVTAWQVPVDAAEDADLLVVGCRGHGGLAEALLGSVGQFCVHHAPCPVVIMRGKHEG
jgi:nucleotide-binding universal stress UspA family protein